MAARREPKGSNQGSGPAFGKGLLRSAAVGYDDSSFDLDLPATLRQPCSSMAPLRFVRHRDSPIDFAAPLQSTFGSP